MRGTCHFCGPIDIELQPGDPGPGEVFTENQARRIIDRHEGTRSHRDMVHMAKAIDDIVSLPRPSWRRRSDRNTPEEYA